jgi:hypothetical protein
MKKLKNNEIEKNFITAMLKKSYRNKLQKNIHVNPILCL